MTRKEEKLAEESDIEYDEDSFIDSHENFTSVDLSVQQESDI